MAITDGFLVSLNLGWKVGVEYLRERGCEVRADDTLFGDVDAVEDGEAEFATELGAACLVDLVAALDSFECLVKGSL